MCPDVTGKYMINTGNGCCFGESASLEAFKALLHKGLYLLIDLLAKCDSGCFNQFW